MSKNQRLSLICWYSYGMPPLRPDGLTKTGELYTPQQLSDLLKVPVQTIYSWLARDQGPKAIKVGRHLRFAESEVEAWLSHLAEAQ